MQIQHITEDYNKDNHNKDNHKQKTFKKNFHNKEDHDEEDHNKENIFILLRIFLDFFRIGETFHILLYFKWSPTIYKLN